MKETSRRNLLKVAALGSAALGLTAGTAAVEGKGNKGPHGPLTMATVTFGAWETDPVFDRFTVPTPAPPATRNHHSVLPEEAMIQAGGSVAFLIAGFHLILIYDHATKPDDINPDLLIPGFPPGMIDDPNRRIYRGVDPRLNPQDRIEVVTFHKPGRYLVICGVRPHFVNDDMYGYVKVLP